MTATSQYPTAIPELRLRPPKEELLPTRSPSFGRRAFRFLLAVGIGIGGTLAWQAHGDEARQMIAAAYPERLGWIAPPAPTTAPAPQSARDAESAPALESAAAPLVSAAPPAPSVDEEQLKGVAADLSAMRQSVEQLAGQVASGQQQVSNETTKLGDEIAKLGDEIGKLRATEQDILNRLPTPPQAPSAQSKPQRPVTAPVRRPAPPPVPQVR